MTLTAEINNLLDQLDRGELVPRTAATEQDWYRLWHAQSMAEREPLAMSLLAGALADRPAWVFHGGYQGMLRQAFSFCPAGHWASYLVAEDRSAGLPGTQLKSTSDGMRLSGHKNWVAASDHVRHLIVSTAKEQGRVLVLIDRDAPGVSLSSREKPGFLAEMSQGYAAFEDVAVGQALVFDENSLAGNFNRLEPLHVITALNAFMLSQGTKLAMDSALRADCIESIYLAAELAETELDAVEELDILLDMDRVCTETASAFDRLIADSEPVLRQRFDKDRALVSMFTRGLQKQKAKPAD